MTSKEFEDYLDSIGGLVNGYYPNRIINKRNSFDVADGWLMTKCDEHYKKKEGQ